MKKYRYIFILLLLLELFTVKVFAQSDYVLPYPSSMPGNFLYKPKLFIEYVSRHWYFGNFGQFKYNLKESDKYLVEAKTLFEYGQYLRADTISLKISDEYFKRTLPFLIKAKNEDKDIKQNRRILEKAAEKHIKVLKKLLKELPQEFMWKPEKGKSTIIFIRRDIEQSISIRAKYL